ERSGIATGTSFPFGRRTPRPRALTSVVMLVCAPSRLALTKRLPRWRHGCGSSAIVGRGRGPMFASPGTHATSTTATAEARSAGNLALPPGQALSREPWLRGEGRSLRLRSRRGPRRRITARRHRRIEARLQSRAGAARHQPDGGLRSGLARRAFHRAPRPRARPARAQTLPVAWFWLARRVDERSRRSAGRAQALAASPRRKAPLAPRRRTSAES